MRFERHLIHRCTLTKQGIETGKDSYNKPIYGEVITQSVPCRVDQIRRRVSRDEYGTDVLVENILFLSSAEKIDTKTLVSDLKDKEGSVLLEGTHSVQSVNPIYKRDRLHHYEATLKKERD